MYRGVPQNNIGLRTDVLDGVPKAIGMAMLIRSMSPKVIVADEIGSDDDIDAIKYAICSGVKGLFTAHGETMEDLKINPVINNLVKSCCFERIIFLSDKNEKCGIDKVYYLDTDEKNYSFWDTSQKHQIENKKGQDQICLL